MTRRSQFSNAPTEQNLALTEWDGAVFKLLHPEFGYQELPSNWIIAFVGGFYVTRLKRLTLLSQPPHSYLQRIRPKKHFFRHSTFTRTEKLDKILDQKPSYVGGWKDHLHYIALIVASTELGIKADPEAKLVKWHDLTTIGWTTNNGTFRVNDADDILKLKNDHSYFTPDWRPFRIERKGKAFFIFDEAERTDKNGKELKEKIVNWQTFFKKDQHRRRFNFGSNTFVRFTFANEPQMKRAMAITEPTPHFLFSHWPDFSEAISFPDPTTTFYTHEYLRVGHTPVNFSKLGEV